jgi:adenosylmethionine-8-amino-7-oxononanoate aminotransferase
MSATGISSYWPMFEPRVPGFVHIPSPYPYRYQAPGESGVSQGIAAANELEQAILREGADTVAMFIAEPV